jgi:5-hydroxyisourate hydrolase
MSGITTHVLDTARGKPAAGVPIQLELRDERGGWAVIGRGTTDDDGRLRTLTSGTITAGAYRITFETAAYFARANVEGFYPEVSVVFEVRDANAHYHVPLLISPYGYSTYRGS